jgi:hypothetical protein
MSDLYSVIQVIEFASNVIGKKGPLEIDMGVYAHQVDMDEGDKLSDIYVLGNADTDITFDDILKMLNTINGLVEELGQDRTYFLEDILSDGFCWGS